MARTISSIYGNTNYIIPFNPNVVYRQSNEDYVETELVRDAMFLKQSIHVTYEKAIHWLEGRANKSERNECVDKFAKQLSSGVKKVCNRLHAISNRYSLTI